MATLASITDNFTSGAFDTAKWSSVDIVTKTGGRARIPNVAGEYHSLNSVLTTLRNDHVLAQLYPPSTAGAGSAPMLVMSITNVALDGQEISIDFNREDGTVMFMNKTDYWEDPLPPSATVTYNATNHRWAAIADGSDPVLTSFFGVATPDTTKVYFFTSPTGEAGTWTEQRAAARVVRPAWVTTTQDDMLVFTSHRSTGTAEYAEIDNVNLPPASAPPATVATSTLQDDFASGNISKWPSSYGTPGIAVVTGKAQLTSSPTERYNGLRTDNAVLPRTLDYLESEVYVQGGSSQTVVFGLFSGNGGESAALRWEAGFWNPVVWNSTYGNVVTAGTPVAAAANTTLRLAMAIGAAASRYGEATPVTGKLYMYTAPAGTTTWTKRFEVAAASVPAWITTTGGYINFENAADGVGSAKITVDDVNLLTSTVVPTVPSAPVATATRQATPTSIRVDWSEPADIGNSPILDYGLRIDGTGEITPGPTSRAIIYPDQSLGAHSIVVRARNGVGYGPGTTVTVDAYTAPTGLPLLGLVTDDFNDNTLDAGWVANGIEQKNGVLSTVAAPSTNPATLYYRGSAVGQSVWFRMYATPTAGVTTGMFLRSSIDRTKRLRIFVRDGVIYSASEDGAVDPGQQAKPYVTAAHVHWRFRHISVSATVVLETSADKIVWTPLRSVAAPSWLSDAEVGIEVFTGNTTTPPPSTSVPSVPTSVVRNQGARQADGSYFVSMTWAPPTSDGGSQITGYVVSRDGTDTSGAGAWSQTVAPTVRNQSFMLLVPGTAYTFSVRAVTANGQGAVSSGSLTMPAAPVTPPPTGATFTEDFLTLPNFTGAGTVWYPGYVYWGGYAGAIEPAGNSWNAVPSEVRNGLSVQPYSIIDDASALDGKALRITCRKASAAEKTAFGGKDWIGGSMESKASYTYGYFEWRMRLPNPGAGMFPALWLMSAENPDNTKLNDAAHASAEIDVLEVFGPAAGSPWSSGAHMVPGGTVPGGNPHVGLYTGNDDTRGWHTYGLEWTATKLRIWRDGVQVAARDDLAAWFAEANSGAGAKMRVRMNYTVATAGNPSWMPSTDASTPSSLYMDIDYMRIYAQRPGAQDVVPSAPATSSITNLQPTTLTVNWTPPANSDVVGVTGYTVGWGSWTSNVLPATQRSMDLTGFTANTAYTISIKAVNAAGQSTAKTQAVTTPAAPVTPTNPALQGLPSKVTATYVPNWNGTIDAMAFPASYNLLYLFAATKGAAGGQYVWNTTNPINLAAARARGTRIILSFGGSGQGYGFTTAGEVTAFVNSVKAINVQFGGSQSLPVIDGIDLNTYEGGITPDVTLYQSIVSQLRTYFGSNFIVTTPPAPWNGVDKTFCAAMLASGHFSYVAPQYYDGPGLSDPAYIASSVQDWITNVAAGAPSKVVVGFGIAAGQANYSTLAQVTSAWNTIEAANPTIKGAFLWEAHADQLTGWQYATNINPLVAS